jgi:hypothetical protein
MTRWAKFIASTSAVARPMGVLPTSSGPSRRKWWPHLWRRGLKRRVSLLVFGSMPVRFGPLVQVVLVAGQRQVVRGVPAPVLLGNDVFDVEGEKRVVVLVQPAVFAAVGRPATHQFSRGLVHQEAEVSWARALAWRIATMSAAMT